MPPRGFARFTATVIVAASSGWTQLQGQASPGRTTQAAVVSHAVATTSGPDVVRERDTQRRLVSELRRAWHARPARAMPGWTQVLRSTERSVGLAWRGPEPVVLVVPDAGDGFACPEGRCDGRFEGTRIVSLRDRVSDTTVVGVILLAESAVMSDAVWRHELTHALLAQHGFDEASARHDPRYFPTTRARLASHRR